MIEPYQTRVVTERKELKDKLDKLNSFIKNGGLLTIKSAQEKRLLELQSDTMAQYIRILDQRIALFQ